MWISVKVWYSYQFSLSSIKGYPDSVVYFTFNYERNVFNLILILVCLRKRNEWYEFLSLYFFFQSKINSRLTSFKKFVLIISSKRNLLSLVTSSARYTKVLCGLLKVHGLTSWIISELFWDKKDFYSPCGILEDAACIPKESNKIIHKISLYAKRIKKTKSRASL